MIPTEEYLGEQPLDEEQEELRDLIYQRLELFQEQNEEYHNKAKTCRQILHMDDPEQDNAKTFKKNGKKTLQLQTLKSTINNVVADQMLSMPEAKLLPETEGTQTAADDLQDLIHYVMYVANDYESIHYRRCEDFYATGTAVIQVTWDKDMDYGRGNVALIRWPLEAFLWDPYSEKIQECRAVMKVSWHPLSWYREHWPEEGKYVGSENGSHSGVGLTQGQEQASHANDEDRALLIEYWWREYDAKTRRYTVNVAYAAGMALLEVQRDVYDHGRYPFVIDVCDSIEGSLAGEGLVSELVPMMRYINRYAAYADMNARMSSKARMLTKRSAGIDKEALVDWEADIIEGDRIIQGEDYGWLSPAPFNGSITQLMTMFQSDLKADSGANQFTRGETTGGIVSGKAINSLIQAGGKISSMRTEQLKYGSKEMVDQISWLLSQFLDDGRVLMITGRDGMRQIKVDTKAMFGVRGKNGVNPPPYSVQIEIASRDPQRIANQNQMFMEAFTMSAQTGNPMRLSSLFKMLNLDGKDRILPLIEEGEHYAEQMAAMQQQMEQMAQQMEAMQAENDNLKKGVDATANTLSTMGNRRGNGVIAPPRGQGRTKMAEAGGGDQTTSAVVNAARNTMGQPLGVE